MNKIMDDRLNYNKALITNSYITLGKYKKAHELVVKIENEVKGESDYVRRTMVEIANIYNKLGYSGKYYSIYNELKEGRWGKCEDKLLEKFKLEKEVEKVKKFAPPPQEHFKLDYPEEKENKIDEKVVIAKFYLERKKSRMTAYELLKEILNSEKESNFTTRKVMYQTAKLYGQIGLNEVQNSIEMDLKEGKWGECEEKILNKLNDKDKKDLWDKTKELFNNKKKPSLKKSSTLLFSKC